MKRFWIGAIILCLLLAVGATTTWAMITIHRPITADLLQAKQAAVEKDWPTAEKYADSARQQWQKWHRFTASVADHAPMDEIDGLFAELDVYAQERDTAHFSALCGNLSQLTRAMAESHSPTWWNLL